jgi:hypothetical protein
VKPTLGKRRAVQVRVTSRGGRTRVQVQERLGELAVTLHSSITVGGGLGGLAVILGVGLGALSAGPEVAVLSTAWVGGMYAIARAIFRGVARQKRADLEGLSSRLGEIASESARNRLTGGEPTRAIAASPQSGDESA